MDKLKPKTVKWPLERVEIQSYEFSKDDPVGTVSVECTMVRVIDMLDRAAYEAVIREACEAGIDHLFLMDKQFVLDALREKLERDYYGRT